MENPFSALFSQAQAEPFDESVLPHHPMELFSRWFGEIKAAEVLPFPESFSLATVTPDGDPACRIVLMKEHSLEGIQFFTHFTGPKGRHLEAKPKTAATFYWPGFERQVRLVGTTRKLSDAESDAYFQTRPRESALGAWASTQSAYAEGAGALAMAYMHAENQFEGQVQVPRPPHWGGYCIEVFSAEFWQGRPFRLHDRFIYEREREGWGFRRLFP